MVVPLVMARTTLVFILVIFIQVLGVPAAQKTNQDYVVLKSLKDAWENTPPSWDGSDPCRDNWEGIGCTNSRVTSITLSSMELTGQLPADIQNLSELLTLDLSYNKGLTGPLRSSVGNLKKLSNLILVGCSFTGVIPDTIGSLQAMKVMSLNSNGFIGQIPPSIGNLSKLYWLDLADNKLWGKIPVSNGTMPGLDMLVNTKHFHFGNNQLSGEIPSKLFNSRMTLIHVLFENNQLTGAIPSTLGLVQTLEVVRLDRNSFSGPVPSNLNNLINVNELFLSNNILTGPLPNLTGMNFLSYVDMSNNTFDMSDFPPWFSTLQALTTLVMEDTKIQGQVPVALFSIPQLETAILRNNHLNGTFDIGSNYSSQLLRVDLQNNNISAFTQRVGYDIDLILVGNPICGITGLEKYCILPRQANYSYSTPPNNCMPIPCNSFQTSSPNCLCANPYTGTLFFRAPSFSNLGNSSYYTSLQLSLMSCFQSHQLPVDSVSLRNPIRSVDDYLVLKLEIFPSGQDFFNRTEIYGIGLVLSNQIFKPPINFGPFFFISDVYGNSSSGVYKRKHKSSNNSGSIIIGAAVGVCGVVMLLLVAGIYAFRQKRRAERATQQNNPFASWDTHTSSGGVPQLKGVRCFSFEDLKKFTDNFSEANAVGSGGYGKVYRGTLPSGLLVAIKRAEQKTIQGGLEFKTEIELLSRVHHKNVISLVGFCFEQGEQMLVYEYILNGTLKESLSGKSGIRLDWMKRLQIALGAAKGLHYLHDLANPPIIHRGIKSNNILLDEHLNAKVTDFSLSKSMGDAEKGHVTTQVKGTMGYLDPEYYMTQQLTEKSDVYSFGVLMLELITARRPIEKGKFIVGEVKLAMDKTKDLYNLRGILDPAFGLSTTLRGFEKFVDLAMSCVDEAGDLRPIMSEVVKEIENIMQLAGLNPNTDLSSTSAGYEGASRAFDHPYTDKGLFIHNATYQPPKLEPK